MIHHAANDFMAKAKDFGLDVPNNSMNTGAWLAKA